MFQTDKITGSSLFLINFGTWLTTPRFTFVESDITAIAKYEYNAKNGLLYY